MVENYVALVAFTLGSSPVKKGTWIQSWWLCEKLWKGYKAGEYNGFSLEGEGGE